MKYVHEAKLRNAFEILCFADSKTIKTNFNFFLKKNDHDDHGLSTSTW